MSAEEVSLAEWRLLVFGTWLHQSDYASGTVIAYVGAVKKWHEKALGLPPSALGIVFHRLPVLFRVIKKLNPGKKRDKRPWEFAYSIAVVDGWLAEDGRSLDFWLEQPSPAREFRMVVAWEVIKLAFEQLLRLAEIVTTVPPSVSMRDPLKVVDLVFYDQRGEKLTYDARGRPVGMPVKATLREPPSKTRGGGGTFTLPFPRGWQTDASCLASGPGLYRFLWNFPVARNRAQWVPLFGMTQFRPDQSVVQLSQQGFVTAMHAICRGASPEIRYEGLGLHAYRVGGTNRLIDIGASAPQVCAAGRWLGDCWVLYARRQRAVLDELTLKMSVK